MKKGLVNDFITYIEKNRNGLLLMSLKTGEYPQMKGSRGGNFKCMTIDLYNIFYK